MRNSASDDALIADMASRATGAPPENAAAHNAAGTSSGGRAGIGLRLGEGAQVRRSLCRQRRQRHGIARRPW